MYTHTHTHTLVCASRISRQDIFVSHSRLTFRIKRNPLRTRRIRRAWVQSISIYITLSLLFQPATTYPFPPLLPGFLLSHRCSSSSFFLVLALTWSSTNFRLTPGEGPRWTRTCSTNPLHRSPRTPLCAHRRRNVVLDSET